MGLLFSVQMDISICYGKITVGLKQTWIPVEIKAANKKAKI